MKEEDFNRLKEICAKEGFDVLNITHDENEKYVLVKKAKEKVQVNFWEFDEDKITFRIYGVDLKSKSSELAQLIEDYLNK